MDELTSADQFREALRIGKCARSVYANHTGEMLCVCRRRIPIQFMHRCFHCGYYFCPACAKEHFGERKNVPAHRGEK